MRTAERFELATLRARKAPIRDLKVQFWNSSTEIKVENVEPRATAPRLLNQCKKLIYFNCLRRCLCPTFARKKPIGRREGGRPTALSEVLPGVDLAEPLLAPYTPNPRGAPSPPGGKGVSCRFVWQFRSPVGETESGPGWPPSRNALCPWVGRHIPLLFVCFFLMVCPP